MICLICNIKVKNRKGLSSHLRQTHKLNKEQICNYFQKLINDERKKDPDKFVQCKICNNYYKSLQSHINSKHDIKTSLYLERYGGNLFSSECLKIKKDSALKSFLNKSAEEKSLVGRKAAETRKRRNSNKGGRPSGFKHTKEEKERHKKWMLKNNPFRGKKHSKETKIKMSTNHADFKGDKKILLKINTIMI